MTTVDAIVAALRSDPHDDAASYRVVLTPSEDLYLAVDALGRPSLLAPVARIEEKRSFVLGNVRVGTHARIRFDIGGSTRETAGLIVTCLDRERPQSFSVFLLDLVHRLKNEPDPAIVVIEAALREWHEMLTWRERLTRDQEIGLWGELALLRALPDPDRGLECWTGPSRDQVDFRGGGVALECKTSLSRGLHLLSLEQVEQVEADLVETYLVSVWMGPDSAGESLPELIDSIERQLVDSAAFRRRLLEVGYAYEQRDLFDDRFALLRDPILVRMADVPRVREVDPGVSSVRFTVSLEGCPTVAATDASKIYERLVAKKDTEDDQA